MKVPKKAKRPKQPELPDLPQSNPFVDGLVEWMDSPEGQLSIEAMDLVFALLEKVQVDAKARQLIWTDVSDSLLTPQSNTFMPSTQSFPPN